MLLVECWNNSSINEWHHNSVSWTINSWPLERNLNIQVSYVGYSELHGLFFGHVKLSPPSWPITWKPNTVATWTLVFTIPPISRGSMFFSNQLLMGAVIEHLDCYFTMLSWRLSIVKLPQSPRFFLTGSKYTWSCCDSKYPPYVTIELLSEGTNLKIQSVNHEIIAPVIYSIGLGMDHGLPDIRWWSKAHFSMWVLWRRNCSMARQKSKELAANQRNTKEDLNLCHKMERCTK